MSYYSYGPHHFDMGEVTMITVENLPPVPKLGSDEPEKQAKMVSVYFSGCLKPTIEVVREDNELNNEAIKRLLGAFKESCYNGYIEERQ